MSRFEITMTDGEKILVDHTAGNMEALLSQLNDNAFVMFNEIRVGATTQPREVILASRQVTLIRPADSDSRQSSTFRPKR